MFAIINPHDCVTVLTINVLLDPFIQTPDQLEISITNTFSAEVLKLLALENRHRLTQAQAYICVTSAY